MRYRIIFVLVLLSIFSFNINADETLLPPVKFEAKLTSTALVVSYTVPNGYYTYLQSPYAKPLSIRVTANDYFNFGKAEFPQGQRKEDEIVLAGSGEIKIPILSSKTAASGNVTLYIEVGYQLCYTRRMVCYSPVSKTLNFNLSTEDVSLETKNDNFDYSSNGSSSDSDYKGESSGPTVSFSPETTGYLTVSHLQKNIRVNNRLRIIVKGPAGAKFGPSIRYWKNERWTDLKHPWVRKDMNEDGTYQMDLFFPYAGKTHITIYGRNNFKTRNYKKISYVVTSTGTFKKKDIPMVTTSKFKSDGFKLVTHKNYLIEASRVLNVGIKGTGLLSVQLLNLNTGNYLYRPWRRHKVVNGNHLITLHFPEKGKYQLVLYGRKKGSKKSAKLYFFYTINNSEPYSASDIGIELDKGFAKLGFKKEGLSHKKQIIDTGRSLKLRIVGKKKIELRAGLYRTTPYGLYTKPPRVFIMNKDEKGVFDVYAYFSTAGKYTLKLYGVPVGADDKYGTPAHLMDYTINASGGYSDRDLDIKMGLYHADKIYTTKKKKKTVTKKVEYGAAGDLLWVTDMAQAKRISKSQKRILMVQHSATWCSFCKKLRKETFRDPSLVRYAKNKFVCIEVGNKPIRNLALYNRDYKKYKTGTPSVSFISPAGKKLFTRTGYTSAKNYIKVLKKALGTVDGSEGRKEATELARLIRLHKNGDLKDSKNLGMYYVKKDKTFKAIAVFTSMVKSGKVPHQDLPWYYHKIAFGSNKESYYKKIINGYSYKTGYNWYLAVYNLAKHYFDWGRYYGGKVKVALNMKKAIDFLTPYAKNEKYSILWRVWFYELIGYFNYKGNELQK